MTLAAATDRLRHSLAHRSLPPVLAALLAGFYVATTFDRTAFGLPFLVVWAAFVAAFYLGWAALRVTHRLADRRTGWGGVLALGAVALVAVGAAVAWYLVSRRALGVDRTTSMWAGAILALSILAGGAIRRWRPAPAIAWLLPVQVVTAWIALRGYLLTSDMRLYDFEVYLGGGIRFVEGTWPYLMAPLERLPPTAAEDVFLYPPPLLPLIGWLASVAEPLRSQAWIALIFLASVPALRLLGLGWPFVAAFILFPPLIKGVESGNVASVTFLILAAGALVPAMLPVGLLFKPQFAITSLWLLRERRWRSVLVSALLMAVIVAATLPFVGVDLWVGWIEGLRHREASQHDFPMLFGYSLAQYLPLLAFAALAILVVAVPLFMRGERSLAGLALATIVAAPSLWPHGFAFALPALLALPAPALWFALGLADGPWMWGLVVGGYLGLAAGRWDREEPITDPTHPLVGATGVWRRRPRDQPA